METDKKKRPYQYLYAFFTLLFLFGVILVGVEIFCFSEGFYRKEFQKLGTAEYVGVDEESVNRVTKVLLDYLKGKRDDINVTVEVNGVMTEFYNDREKAHMMDVRALYRWTRIVGYGGMIVLLFLMTLSLILKDHDIRMRALDGYITGNIIFLGLVTLVSIWAVADFNSFWVSFHRLFFTNDLWLLDPYTDRMINVFEEQLFFDLVIRIALFAIAVMVIILFAVILYRKDIKNKREREFGQI